MPTITSTHHQWSAREVLFARCAHCAYVLNWVNCRKSDGVKRAATCCSLAYMAVVDEEHAPYFIVTTMEVDMMNVIPLF